jgi:hypothetical protein
LNKRPKYCRLNSDAYFLKNKYKHRIIIYKYVNIYGAVGSVSGSTTRRRRRHFLNLEKLDKPDARLEI